MASATCEVCGNEYDKAFQVIMEGTSHTFDSFECALSLAPCCAHCGCRILGHGLEEDSESSAARTARGSQAWSIFTIGRRRPVRRRPVTAPEGDTGTARAGRRRPPGR